MTTRRSTAIAVIVALLPFTANAAALIPRSVQLGSSQAGVTTTNTVAVMTATTSNIGSIGLKYCTTAAGACTTPAGLVTTSASLTGQIGIAGFSINNVVNGAPFISNGAVPNVNVGTLVTLNLSSIVNPSSANTTFFIRVTTYIGTDGATSVVDAGTVAVSTAQEVQLTGVTPEILIFCVGITITTDCSSMTGSNIDFGDFSPQSTRTGSSVMQASTNATGGYSVTVNGTTLASGVNTIPALAAQTISTVGTGQFGLNLRANFTPAVGADPTGAGTGTFTGTYGAQNQYRFNTGDSVATAAMPTNANTYTSSYIVNIGGIQAAGVYTSTMTYICTANF